MVVGKTTKKRYQVRVTVSRLEGLPASRRGTAAVAIRWRGPPRAGGVPYLRPKGRKEISGEAAVGSGGEAKWEEEEGFENVCCFCSYGSDSNPDSSFRPWDVSFSILHGLGDDGRKEKKLAKIGTTSVNLIEWVCESQFQMKEERKLHIQQKQIPISLTKDNSVAMLFVDVSFVEVRTSDGAKGTPTSDGAKGTPTTNTEHTMQPKGIKREGDTSDTKVIDEPCTFDTNVLGLAQLLQLADESNKLVTYRSRNNASSAATSGNNSGGSSPELQSGLAPNHRRFFSWGKTKKDVKGCGGMNTQSCSSPYNTSQDSDVDDTIGKWEGREFVSRDRQMKLKTVAFFASIDQRDESTGGESACTALVAVIADALHANELGMPTRAEFDALIKEGSSEWQKLCHNASLIDRFPNKHFDLDTVIDARIRPVSVLPEKSFIGFFQPESFTSLQGAMSFEDIWDEINRDTVKFGYKIYIVSWNDHFFLLKVEADAYYIIDTLGERLFEGCNKAYMLKFDDSSEMYNLSGNDNDVGDDELVCSGKECCKGFIEKFLAAIQLREELEMEEKGTNNTTLHQRLQIEFHRTNGSNWINNYWD